MTIQIFISCVSDEFGTYRDELRRQLKRPNVDVHIQEDFIETGVKLLETLDHYIAGCDAVIHLAGDMTGSWASRPAVQGLAARHPNFAEKLPSLKQSIDTGDPPVSYTQWEAYLAVYHSKALVIAVPEPGTARDPKYRSDTERKASQRVHLARLRTLGHYAKITFGNTDQLTAAILRSNVLELLASAGGAAPESMTAAAQAAPVSIDNKPNALPYPSIGALFKGRDRLLADLYNSLARPPGGSSAWVISNAVYGLGGIGKTRLAVEYAWRHADDYSALLFVVANTPDELRRNLAALAGPTVLNLLDQAVTDEGVRAAAVLRWLQQHPRWLLIIDNVDTKEAADAVEDLLPKLHGGEVIITSRLAEWSGSVERLDVDVLSEDAAQAFLLERTVRDRRKAADDDSQARALALEVGCLALALEQGAAYINRHRLSFAQYIGQWHANRDKVTTWFDARVMKYKRSVAVTWQTSVDQLSESARHLLQRLAWLAPEPIPESLVYIAIPGKSNAGDDQIAALAELESYSLVARSRDATAFTVHRLVQDVTQRSLVGDDRSAVLTSALAWMDRAFEGNAYDLRVPPKLELLAPHVRAVTNHADSAEIFDWNPWLLIRLGDLLRTRAPLAEVEPLYRRALAKVERLAKGDPNNADRERDLSGCYVRVGDMLVAQGNLPEALKSFHNSLAIAERLAKADPNNAGRQDDLSVSCNEVGNVLEAQGNLAEALESYRKGLAIGEDLATAHPNNATWLWNLMVSYANVGDVLVAQRNLPEALKSFGNSRAIGERLAEADPNNGGLQRDLSVSYNKIGGVLMEQGNLSGALEVFRDSVAIIERLAQADANNAARQRDLSVSYSQIGDVLAAQGNLPEALKSFRDSLMIRERLARTDPENVQWQVDVLWTHWRLAQRGDDSARRWMLIVTKLRALKAADKLTAEQARWLPEAETRLAEAESARSN
jgi:tetratricopeptide (TPR) repeat protein